MAIQFEAPLITINGWQLLHLPQAASSQLPSRGQVMVKGTAGDVQFQEPLEPDGMGGHWLKVDERLQKAIAADEGDVVAVTLEATKDWPEPELPADWQAAVETDAEIQALWRRITPMARWEWLRWISSTAQPGTRQRRIEASLSKLRAGERRPCCFNRNMCCVPQVSKNGVLLDGTPQRPGARY